MTAVLSYCATYRYTLVRRALPGLTTSVCWVMLNPSTADATQDDPTIRRCIDFSRRWGYGLLAVVNLFALRSTDPKVLAQHADPVGPHNDSWIKSTAEAADLIVCAWGVDGRIRNRGLIVRRDLERIRPVHHLGLTVGGFPRHPLYLRGDVQPETWTA